MRSNTAVEPGRRGQGRPGLQQPGLLRDLLLSLLFAVTTGLAGGLLLILLVFGCVEAQAAAEPLQGGRAGAFVMEERPGGPGAVTRIRPLQHSGRAGTVSWLFSFN